jgi:hypothetical protein
MKVASFVSWVVVASLAASGCGRGSGVDRGQLLGEMVSAVCSGVAPCCDAASLAQANKCRDEVTRQMSAIIADPELEYDATQGEDCVNAVGKTTKACGIVDYSPCIEAFSGNLPPGASCNLALDCAKGPYGFAVCSSDNYCVQPKRGGPNEPCAYSCTDGAGGAKCQNIYTDANVPVETACHSYDRLICVSGSAGPTCQPITGDCRQRQDASCPGGGSCDSTTGLCLAPVPIGGNCTNGNCVTNGYCQNDVCQPLKPLSAPCNESIECESKRCDGVVCAVSSPAASTMCGASLKR